VPGTGEGGAGTARTSIALQTDAEVFTQNAGRGSNKNRFPYVQSEYEAIRGEGGRVTFG
jgi:hypothetical protein